MDVIAIGLSTLADPVNVLMLALGTAIGIVIGAIPGLSATMAVALALPFTFAMTPVAAMLLLVGIYKGGIFGGSATAILIKSPGTPASAATVLDGYPLARKGRGRAALEMALYASVIADFISNLSLLIFAGMLAKLASQFGPPQYFWLIVFSLTVVISVSGESLLKGLASAAIGLLISAVGLDILHGTQRMTFGYAALFDGVALVPFIIGLFAIPEVMAYYAERGGRRLDVTPTAGPRLMLAELRQSLVTIIKGSLIGVVIGALPGTGSTAAAFVSYGEARRSSPRGHHFGTGELEGVAASESGNNGVAGASMIPLLTLGIPGDTVTAVMLGAFLIHGMTPGPLLFQDHLPFIYALFISIMFSSLVLLALGQLAIRGGSWIATVPRHLLVPLILLLCIVGSFAVNNSFFDVGVMAAAGILGFLFTSGGIPLAPCVIGLVLGNLLEDNFRRTMLLGRGEFGLFFAHPVCWVFMALTLLSVGFGLYQQWRPRRPRDIN